MKNKKIEELVKLLQDNKIKNISVYDLSTADAEKYIIVSTSNKVVDSKKAADVIAASSAGEWIVFDFENLTLHIFLPKLREKYNLDKLYKPKKIVL